MASARALTLAAACAVAVVELLSATQAHAQVTIEPSVIVGVDGKQYTGIAVNADATRVFVSHQSDPNIDGFDGAFGSVTGISHGSPASVSDIGMAANRTDVVRAEGSAIISQTTTNVTLTNHGIGDEFLSGTSRYAAWINSTDLSLLNLNTNANSVLVTGSFGNVRGLGSDISSASGLAGGVHLFVAFDDFTVAHYFTDASFTTTTFIQSLNGFEFGLGAPEDIAYRNGTLFWTGLNGPDSYLAKGAYDADAAVLAAIPEPATYAALLSLGALGVVFVRRRREASA